MGRRESACRLCELESEMQAKSIKSQPMTDFREPLFTVRATIRELQRLRGMLEQVNHFTREERRHETGDPHFRRVAADRQAAKQRTVASI